MHYLNPYKKACFFKALVLCQIYNGPRQRYIKGSEAVSELWSQFEKMS